MSFSPASTPKRCATVICEHLPDGSTLLFDTNTHNSIAITQSAAMVWDSCDGVHTVEAIVAELMDIYEVPEDVATADMGRLLDDLAGRGLIEPASGSS